MSKSNKNKAKFKYYPKNVILPTALVELLDKKILETAPDFKFDITIAKIFLWLVINRTSNDWDIELFDEYIPIPHQIFEYYNPSKYTKYLNYLEQINLIEHLGWKNFKDESRCKMFRLSSEALTAIWNADFSFTTVNVEQLISQIRISFRKYEISPALFIKLPHLVSWYNSKLTVDYDLSLDFIKQSYLKTDDIFRNLYKLRNFKESNFYATQNESSDGRLHTNLSNFPRELRQFLRYDGQSLVSYDLKASQPYFLIALIESLFREMISKPPATSSIEGNYEENERLIKEKIKRNNKVYSYILDTFRETSISEGFTEEFNKFKSLYYSDIYDELGQILIPDEDYYLAEDENGQNVLNRDGNPVWIRNKYVEYNDKYKKKKMKTVPMLYDSKRDMMKVIVLNILYGGTKRPCQEYKLFEENFPYISQLMKAIKKDKKEDFPRLLQQIESDCILNFVTLKLSEKYPEMPIWTIHDSIITTYEYANSIDLKSEITDLIREYSGVEPLIKEEMFCENCIVSAA